MTDTCASCRHFNFIRQGNAARVGECRRNAPAPTTRIVPQVEATWPQVLESMSCGEFAPIVAASEKTPPSDRPARKQQAQRTARRTRPAEAKATR